jgi:hypothetical protein
VAMAVAAVELALRGAGATSSRLTGSCEPRRVRYSLQALVTQPGMREPTAITRTRTAGA